MKVRSDFVSNSSSCSFVIAISKEYDIDMFCKDLAKACTNPKAQYHDKKLAKRNQAILDFCLSSYELAFLGTWKLRTDETVLSKEEHHALWADFTEDEDKQKVLNDEAEKHWQYELDRIEKAKSPNCDPYFKKMVERNYIDKDGKLHVFNDIYVGNCAVDSDTMRYDFCRYGYDRDNEKFSTDIRIKHLKQLAEDEAAHKHGKFIARPYVNCYAITMSTVKNTRDLLESGADIELDEYEDLDKFQKRLEAGEKIFGVRIGYSGEGYGNYEIHCEENADKLEHLAVEILDSEPM